VPDANPTFVFEMSLIGQIRSEKILANVPLLERGAEIASGASHQQSRCHTNCEFTFYRERI
jgi:hypothetical protein